MRAFLTRWGRSWAGGYFAPARRHGEHLARPVFDSMRVHADRLGGTGLPVSGGEGLGEAGVAGDDRVDADDLQGAKHGFLHAGQAQPACGGEVAVGGE